MLHLDLFSGIGGFAYAVDQVWPRAKHIFCDNDKFCQQVIRKHWPNSTIYGDIRAIADPAGDGFREGTATPLEEGHEAQPRNSGQLAGGFERPYCDLITGGFPCQPFSAAGRRRGTSDDRYLWPEMFRLIQLFKPRWVIAENVYGLVTWNEGLVLEQVCTDLETEGYEVQPFIIPAVAVNAPHRRDRVWIVANKFGKRLQGGGNNLDRKLQEPAENTGQTEWKQNWLEVATWYGRMDDGISEWMDRCFDSILEPKDYGTTIKKDQTKNLSILREKIQSGEIWEKLGGQYKVEQKEILFSFLCRIEKESNRQNDLSYKGEKIQAGQMRNLRDGWEARCSPRRREHQKQFTRELKNFLPPLPYEVSLEIAKCWDYLWIAYSSMTNQEGAGWTKAQHRVQRLKALGNAIVPEVAIRIMEAIKTASEVKLEKEIEL